MYIILLYLTLFIGIIPIIIQVIKIKNILYKGSIVPFLWLTFLASLYEIIGALIFNINSIYWFQFYPLLSFMAIHYFFKKELSLYIYPIQILLLIIFFVCYSISFFYINDDSFTSTSINRSFISLYVFLFTAFWFKEKFDILSKIKLFDNTNNNILNTESFYLVAGLFIYYSTTFFLFISSNFIYESELYIKDYWLVNILATLVLRVFLIMSAWKMSKT